MKGSAITGPVGKEAAELWPRIASNAGVVMWAVVSGYERTFSLLCGYNTDRFLRFGSDDVCSWAYDTTGSKTGGVALFEWIKDESTHFSVPAAIWLLSWWNSHKLGCGPYSRSHRIRHARNNWTNCKCNIPKRRTSSNQACEARPVVHVCYFHARNFYIE